MGDGPSSLLKEEMRVSLPLSGMRLDAHLAHTTGHLQARPGRPSSRDLRSGMQIWLRVASLESRYHPLKCAWKLRELDGPAVPRTERKARRRSLRQEAHLCVLGGFNTGVNYLPIG